MAAAVRLIARLGNDEDLRDCGYPIPRRRISAAVHQRGKIHRLDSRGLSVATWRTTRADDEDGKKRCRRAVVLMSN